MENTQSATKQQTQDSITMIFAITETIRELGEVPSGHLYAGLMHKISLNSYEAVISMLIRANLVKRSYHLLTWIGPTL